MKINTKGFLLPKEQACALRKELEKGRWWTEIVRDMVHDACYMSADGPVLDMGSVTLSGGWETALFMEAAILLLTWGGAPDEALCLAEGRWHDVDYYNIVRLSVALENTEGFMDNYHITMDEPPSEPGKVLVVIAGIDALAYAGGAS